jgi:hypothetical protein
MLGAIELPGAERDEQRTEREQRRDRDGRARRGGCESHVRMP